MITSRRQSSRFATAVDSLFLSRQSLGTGSENCLFDHFTRSFLFRNPKFFSEEKTRLSINAAIRAPKRCEVSLPKFAQNQFPKGRLARKEGLRSKARG